jgi:hypothetical protein
MNCFEQNELLGVEVKGQGPRGARTPQILTPFLQNELVVDPNYTPELNELVGNTSSMLRTAITMITGRLAVSHSYQRIVANKLGDFDLNRRLVNIATSDENYFEELPNVKVLKGDGQVCEGSFYQLSPEKNGNILASSLAFTDAFRWMTEKSLVQWGNITGLKTIDPTNTQNALDIIKYFGKNPNSQLPVNIGEGDAKDTNPMYQALRKMRESNFVLFDTNPNIVIKSKNNAQLPAMQARVPEIYKPMAVEFANRIHHYEAGLKKYLLNGLGNIFDTTDTEPYGIQTDRMNRIVDALNLYKTLSLSPQSK